MATNPPRKDLDPIDPAFAQTIQRLLDQRGVQHSRGIREASEQVLQWLHNHGRLMRTESKAYYYLYRDENQLVRLDSPEWNWLLSLLTLVNPKADTFAQLNANCQLAALTSELVEVRRLAHWDGSFLRVSSFDGQVFRLDGQTIEREANGDGPTIFEDRANWKPFAADFTGDDSVLDAFLNLANLESPAEEYRLVWLSWIVALFFGELCPTQPLLAALGEAGSGKTSAFRLMVRMLFGPNNNVLKVPDKPDDFGVTMTNNHLVVLDNFDSLESWQRDRIAGVSTGTQEEARKLYTNNELVTTTPSCWIAVTTRTATVLRRDDLADRSLVLPFLRLTTFTAEHTLRHYTITHRSRWWGALLGLLNRIVADVHRNGVPNQSSLRMADFEAIGRIVARVQGREALWDSAVASWSKQASQLVLDDSLIPEALEEWLKKPGNRGRWIKTADLYHEAELALFGTNKPEKTWPRSSKSFGWALKNIRRALQSQFQVDWLESKTRTQYKLENLP